MLDKRKIGATLCVEGLETLPKAAVTSVMAATSVSNIAETPCVFWRLRGIRCMKVHRARLSACF